MIFIASIQNPVEHVVDVLWMVFQPLLFGLIGAAVEINSLEGSTVGKRFHLNKHKITQFKRFSIFFLFCRKYKNVKI